MQLPLFVLAEGKGWPQFLNGCDGQVFVAFGAIRSVAGSALVGKGERSFHVLRTFSGSDPANLLNLK